MRSTHPDYASLVDPLFAARKEGEKYISLSPIPVMLSESEASIRRYAKFAIRSFTIVQDDKLNWWIHSTKKPGLPTGFSYKNNTY
jgi:hypothetical protein